MAKQRTADDVFGKDLYYPALPKTPPGPGAATRGLATVPRAEVNLGVPFIHQLWDTADAFNGHWACGPTSTTMVLGYYKAIPPKPLKTKHNPKPSEFSWYVSNPFTLRGNPFSATAPTADGRAAGVYGTTLDGHPRGGEPFWCTGPYATGFVKPPAARGITAVMGLAMPNHALKVVDGKGFFTPEAFAAAAIPALRSGHPVIVGGRVNNCGHVIVVRGYYREPSGEVMWIVNDPYGFMTTGKGYSGENVVYRFAEMNPRWACWLEPKPLPAPVPPNRPVTRAAAQPAARGVAEDHAGATLALAFEFLEGRFGENVPAKALEAAQPVLAEALAGLGGKRLSTAARMELQARLGEALRAAGLAGK